MSTKYVYLFANGKADGSGTMKDLLGGKGAGLAEMTNAALPVPPGFTITTEACNAYYDVGGKFPEGMWEQVLEAMRQVEAATGKKFGDPADPLLVSVRSGAKFSMPGMMDTVLNLGLNGETLKGMAALTSNERFAYDAYRRFIQMFGKIVLGIDGERPRETRHGSHGAGPPGRVPAFHGDRPQADRRGIPDGPVQAARGSRQGRLPFMERRPGDCIPAAGKDT